MAAMRRVCAFMRKEGGSRLSQDYYELLAMTTRYIFTMLCITVAWQAARWLRQDYHRRKEVNTSLPDAGYLGTLYVMEGKSKRIKPGESLSLPMEGLLGSGAGCDVRVFHPTVGRRHALFEYKPDGLHLRPFRNERMQVDGQPLHRGCEAILTHGAVLSLGEVTLQLRLFAGVKAPEADAYDHGNGRLRR